MPEAGEGGSSVGTKFSRVELLVDPRARAARKALTNLSSAVAPFQVPQHEQLPQILELQAGESEFVSVRRMVSEQLDQIMELTFPNDKSSPGSLRFAVPANYIEESNVALLTVPLTLGPKEEAKELEPEKLMGAEN